jgi:hypothetical protein
VLTGISAGFTPPFGYGRLPKSSLMVLVGME